MSVALFVNFSFSVVEAITEEQFELAPPNLICALHMSDLAHGQPAV